MSGRTLTIAANRRGVLRLGLGGLGLGGLGLGLGLGLTLSGCGFGTWVGLVNEVKVDTVTFVAAPNANDNSPVAIDLVIAYDQMLLGELVKLPARQWFERREQFRRDYPETIQIESWELTPGQTRAAQPIDVRRQSIGALVFANYLTPGEHRVRVGKEKALVITLLAKTFTATG
jgi:type VI secretion system protein